MARLIRIDDFPQGDKSLFGLKYIINSNLKIGYPFEYIYRQSTFVLLKFIAILLRIISQNTFDLKRSNFFANISYRRNVRDALSIFEEYEVPYILGCSPLLFRNGDIEFLNSVINFGEVCMHGFSHGWEFEPWGSIATTWPKGGEFMNMSKSEIERKYQVSNSILSNVKRYTKEHFIPPFNCYTQELVDVLAEKGVKYIHTCDKEYFEYHQTRFDYKGVKVVISEWQKTYANADVVLKNINNPSQITLHWCYDMMRSSWRQDYVELCERVNKVE